MADDSHAFEPVRRIVIVRFDDPELAAMDMCLQILRELPSDQAYRAAAYLTERLAVSPMQAPTEER